MTRQWKLKSALVAGMAALASTAAQAREYPAASDVERPPTTMASRSDGSIIVAGNSSSISSSNSSSISSSNSSSNTSSNSSSYSSSSTSSNSSSYSSNTSNSNSSSNSSSTSNSNSSIGTGASIGGSGGAASASVGTGNASSGASVGASGGLGGASGGLSAGGGGVASSATGAAGASPAVAPRSTGRPRRLAVPRLTAVRQSITLPPTLLPSSSRGSDHAPAATAFDGIPGTPAAVVRACRDAVGSAAAPFGVVSVRARSAGSLRRLSRGAISAPVQVRIQYARQGGPEIRQARIRCHLDASGKVIKLT